MSNILQPVDLTNQTLQLNLSNNISTTPFTTDILNTNTSNTEEDTESKFSAEIKKNFNNALSLFMILVMIIILIVIYFYIGGLVLYFCKLAQSNILPTDTTCFPYTDNKPLVDPIQMNIFTNSDDPPLSSKIVFPYNNYNSKNFLLDSLRNYDKIKPSDNYIFNLINVIYLMIITFFVSIYYDIISYKYYCINIVFNLINKLPQSLIILFGPILSLFLSLVLSITQIFYFIYLWFKNMIFLFEYKKHEEIFKQLGLGGIFKIIPLLFTFVSSFWLFFLFSILFFPFLFVVFPAIMPILDILIQFSSLFYKGLIDDDKVSAYKIMKETLNVYKPKIMIFIAIVIVLMSFSKLGFLSGVISIILLLLIYYGKIGLSFFSASNLTYSLSALNENNDVANKKCDK